MQLKPEEQAEERTRRDGWRSPDRHILAVGKRVRKRWLIEMSLPNPPVAPPLGAGATGGRAA